MAGNTKWAKLNIVTGAKGTGKSSLVDECLHKTSFKNALILLQPVDLYNSEVKGSAFYDFPYLPQITQYAGGKVKISAADIDYYRLFEICQKKYRNGIIVIDEAGRYDLTWRNRSNNRIEPIPPLKDILMQQRKYNIEIYLLYHGVGKIPVQLMELCNNFILFHQAEVFIKPQLPRLQELKEMQERIRIKYFAGNHHYWERIQLT